MKARTLILTTGAILALVSPAAHAAGAKDGLNRCVTAPATMPSPFPGWLIVNDPNDPEGSYTLVPVGQNTSANQQDCAQAQARTAADPPTVAPARAAAAATVPSPYPGWLLVNDPNNPEGCCSLEQVGTRSATAAEKPRKTHKTASRHSKPSRRVHIGP